MLIIIPRILTKKEPGTLVLTKCRANTWRRPTLTGPIVPLPLALWRFTSGFGMGPGGSTTLWSPEGNSLYLENWDSGGLRGVNAEILKF